MVELHSRTVRVTRGAVATALAVVAVVLLYGSLGATDSRPVQLSVLLGVGVIVPLLFSR